ncbi:cytoplasmic tRNA 2-thiolation protein 2 [Trichomonascus vanleenenianus]|uniref:Ncs2p n=1 Tax=Trichomonascus vanleenenianus TaxID=2268995 RepID=UPI003ECB7A20
MIRRSNLGHQYLDRLDLLLIYSYMTDTSNTNGGIGPCKRCKEPAILVSRGESFCRACFIRFVQYRQRKQMEQFKVDYKTPNPEDQHILLALSLGPSSLALLDMAIDTIRLMRQQHRGRQGFYLHGLHIDECPDPEESDAKELIAALGETYPECEFACLPLTAAKSLASEAVEIGQGGSRGESVFALLNKMTRTSRQDASELLKKQLIESFGKQKGCQTVIYGHSQTRLAELIISHTAKGRGAAVPRDINQTLENGYIYPLRDLLRSEISIYNGLKEVTRFVSQYKPRVPATTKLQSIDELVNQYFVSVEEGFPSVVSTVVRTAGKLDDSRAPVVASCSVCGDPVAADTLEWTKKITVCPPTEDKSAQLCYGCIVMFRRTVGSVNWPRYDKNELLKEFEL